MNASSVFCQRFASKGYSIYLSVKRQSTVHRKSAAGPTGSQPYFFQLQERIPIGLMHDYITCPKFSTKPHLSKLFSNFSYFVLFSRWYSFHFCCFGNLSMTEFAFSNRGVVVICASLMSSCMRTISFRS